MKNQITLFVFFLLYLLYGDYKINTSFYTIKQVCRETGIPDTSNFNIINGVVTDINNGCIKINNISYFLQKNPISSDSNEPIQKNNTVKFYTLFNKVYYIKKYQKNEVENITAIDSFFIRNTQKNILIIKSSGVDYFYKNKKCIHPKWTTTTCIKDINWKIIRNGIVYDSINCNSGQLSFKINDKDISYVNDKNLSIGNDYTYQLLGKKENMVFLSDIIKIKNYQPQNNIEYEIIMASKKEQINYLDLEKIYLNKENKIHIKKTINQYSDDLKFYLLNYQSNPDYIIIEYPYILYNNQQNKYIASLDVWLKAPTKKEKQSVAILIQIINRKNNIVRDTWINEGIIKLPIRLEE